MGDDLSSPLESALAALKVVEQAQARAFREPRFTLKQVVAATGAREVTIRNWLTRRLIALDADVAREGGQWRLFSAYDVLNLGLAAKLSKLGFPASGLPALLGQAAKFLAQPGPHFASNVPSYLLVTADGEVRGPCSGEVIELADVDTDFVLVRLDTLIRQALEPLGYSITYGAADAMRETAERLRGDDQS